MADTYTITGQREQFAQGDDGRAVRVVTVTFTTKPGGVVGTVDVPKAGYSPDAVDAAVRAYAATLDAVHNL